MSSRPDHHNRPRHVELSPSAMLITWLVAAVGVGVVLMMPDHYQASARVFVDTQSILRPLMTGIAVQPNIEQQVAMLSRTLLSRPTVEWLVRTVDLDLGAHSKAARYGRCRDQVHQHPDHRARQSLYAVLSRPEP